MHLFIRVQVYIYIYIYIYIYNIYYGSVRGVAALYRSRGYQTKAVNVARLSYRRSSAADRQSVKRVYNRRAFSGGSSTPGRRSMISRDYMLSLVTLPKNTNVILRTQVTYN